MEQLSTTKDSTVDSPAEEQSSGANAPPTSISEIARDLEDLIGGATKKLELAEQELAKKMDQIDMRLYQLEREYDTSKADPVSDDKDAKESKDEDQT